jgi:glycerophosphoryl diester phosphodiesterase
MKLYGHRGAKGEAPENTIEGFLHARALGLQGIETDIAMTADFVPVLHHDPHLADRRLIRGLRLAELPSGIPTLADALAAVPDMELLLEIKTYPTRPKLSHPPAVMVEHTLAVLARMPAAFVRIMAFDWEVLREVEALAPHISRVCLTSPRTSIQRGQWWGPGFAGRRTAHAVAATGAYGWAGYHAALSRRQILLAHSLGLKVFAWTVNAQADFARLAPLADGIITDHPSDFYQTT